MIVCIDLKQAKTVKTNTKYGIKKKQEIMAYDNSYSDHIKLILWNVRIDFIAKNGVCRLQNVKVNSSNGKYLTAIAATVIKES